MLILKFDNLHNFKTFNKICTYKMIVVFSLFSLEFTKKDWNNWYVICIMCYFYF